MSLSSLLDISPAHDFLRGLLALVQEFEAIPEERFGGKHVSLWAQSFAFVQTSRVTSGMLILPERFSRFSSRRVFSRSDRDPEKEPEACLARVAEGVLVAEAETLEWRSPPTEATRACSSCPIS